MANRPWLDEVRRRLARNGLPPTYVQRLVAELTDHFHDLKEETMSTEAGVYSRLGAPEQVAAAAIVAYRRRSFLGRHPSAAFLTFAVSPVALLLVLLLGLGGAMYGADRFFDMIAPGDYFGDSLRHLGPGGRAALPYVMSMLIPVFPCILVSIFYCQLARRLSLARKWMLLSCGVLAIIAGTFVWSAKFSETPGQSALLLCVGIPYPLRIADLLKMIVWIFIHPMRIAQFVAPIAIGCWFMCPKRNRGHLQLAS